MTGPQPVNDREKGCRRNERDNLNDKSRSCFHLTVNLTR